LVNELSHPLRVSAPTRPVANGPCRSSSLVLPLPSSWNSSLRCTRSGPAACVDAQIEQFRAPLMESQQIDTGVHIGGYTRGRRGNCQSRYATGIALRGPQ
jgi:hypothetical protein